VLQRVLLRKLAKLRASFGTLKQRGSVEIDTQKPAVNSTHKLTRSLLNQKIIV